MNYKVKTGQSKVTETSVNR